MELTLLEQDILSTRATTGAIASRYLDSDAMAPRNPARAIATSIKPADFASFVNFSTNALP